MLRYTGKKDAPPEGEVLAFLQAHMPFNRQLSAWWVYVVALGKEMGWRDEAAAAVEAAAAKLTAAKEAAAAAGDGHGAELEAAASKAEKGLKAAKRAHDEIAAILADDDKGQTLLEFVARPSYAFLRKYYVVDESKWCADVLPAKLIEDAQQALSRL